MQNRDLQNHKPAAVEEKEAQRTSEYHMINSTFLKLSKMYLQGFGALQPPHCVLNFGQASKSLGTGSH